MKLSQEQIDLICRKHKDCDIETVCSEMNISRATYYRIIKKHGDPASRVKKKLSKDDIIQIINLWNKNKLSQTEIATKYNVTQTMISNIVNRKSRRDITKSLYIRDHSKNDTASVSMVYSP